MACGLTYIRQLTSPQATKQLAATLSPYLRPGDMIQLKGDLGAGKTQFVQGVAEGLGVSESVVSPTFNVLLSYDSGALPLHHFDLYRLDGLDQLEDTGFYDVVDADGVSFVEWAEKCPGCMGATFLEIELTIDEDETRRIRVHAYGQRARSLLTVWGSDSKSRLIKFAGDKS